MNFFKTPNDPKARLSLFPAAASAIFAALALTGCLNDSTDHHEEEEHAWEHACEHAMETPTAVTASAVDSLAPDVSEGHTLFGVTFAADDKVSFTPDEHGEFAFFLTKNVPVVLTTSAGDTVAFEETETMLTGCAELAVMHVADMEEGAHFLTFGTSAETFVGLIIEEMEHHDH